MVRGGREWLVGAEPVRWFERVSWWEAERRMPKGLSRVDVEVWQVQARLGRNGGSTLTTMEIIRTALAGAGGSGRQWRTPPDRRRRAQKWKGLQPMEKPSGNGKAFHRDYWGMPRWKACKKYTVDAAKCETRSG